MVVGTGAMIQDGLSRGRGKEGDSEELTENGGKVKFGMMMGVDEKGMGVDEEGGD